MSSDDDAEMVRNIVAGATIGSVIGVVTAISIWLGVLLAKV
jgi:hypothetical protein